MWVVERDTVNLRIYFEKRLFVVFDDDDDEMMGLEPVSLVF